MKVPNLGRAVDLAPLRARIIAEQRRRLAQPARIERAQALGLDGLVLTAPDGSLYVEDTRDHACAPLRCLYLSGPELAAAYAETIPAGV